jgi:hypothetical protein
VTCIDAPQLKNFHITFLNQNTHNSPNSSIVYQHSESIWQNLRLGILPQNSTARKFVTASTFHKIPSIVDLCLVPYWKINYLFFSVWAAMIYYTAANCHGSHIPTGHTPATPHGTPEDNNCVGKAHTNKNVSKFVPAPTPITVLRERQNISSSSYSLL